MKENRHNNDFGGRTPLMKILKNILFCSVLLCGFRLSAVAVETNAVSDCSIPWNFSTIARETDTIIIGKAISMKDTFLNPYHHIDFYIINVTDSIFSKDQHIILAVYQNKISSFGSIIHLQPDMEYLFFLKKCKETFNALPSKGTVYETVRFWQGIVPFNIKAKENRSVRRIKEQYNIDLYEKRDSFIEAIKATVAEKYDSKTKKGKKLSEDARELFSRLKLKRAFFISTKQQNE